MTYLLTQFNFWDLCRFFTNDQHKFVYKSAPDYVIKFLKDNGVNVGQSDTRPDGAILHNGSYATWPTEEELNPDILVHKFYIDDNNYNYVIHSIKPGDKLIYSEDLTRQLSPELEKIATFISKKTPEKAPKERIYIDHVMTNNSDLNTVPEEYDIVHYLGNVVGAVKYRRHKLNDFLKEHYKVATIYKGYCDVSKASTLIISDPRGSFDLVNDAVKHNVRIIYDRTDNWNALYPEIENSLFENADVVFCSSQYLFDTLCAPIENKILLPNAGDEWNYTNPTKEKIVVYIGKSTNKTNDELCNKLKEAHPEYKYVSIGAKIEGWENLPLLPKDVMMSYLDHCEIGVIPLKEDDYYKGQLNLKVWDYLNAHLKVYTNNTYNFQGIPNVYDDFEKAINAEFEDVDVPKWKDVFEAICKHIKYKGN